MPGDSAGAFEEHVRVWRAHSTKAAQEAFDMVKHEEKRVPGERPYFYHLERFEQLGIPVPGVLEGREELDPETWAGDPTVQFRFAEEGAGPAVEGPIER